MYTKTVSYDLKYFFTERGVIKIDENLEKKFIKYNTKNLIYGIKMLQENIQIKFTRGFISIDEYMNSSKKFLYEMTRRLKSENAKSIIKEWHNKYSRNNLLTESVNEYQVIRNYNLGWYGVQNLYKEKIYDIILQEGFFDNVWNAGKSAVQWGWDNIKKTISKTIDCGGKSGIDCLMERIRTIATSLIGVAVLTGVSFIPGVGQIPNFIIFGALLIYDLYKMATGKDFSVSDIVVDIISLITPALAKGIGNLLKPITNFIGLGKYVGSALVKAGGVENTWLVNAIKTLINSGTLAKLTGYITQTVSFFTVKLGVKWLADMAQPATQTLTKINDDIKTGMEMAKQENVDLEDDELEDDELEDDELYDDDENGDEKAYA
jgi:hypothetical protein